MYVFSRASKVDPHLLAKFQVIMSGELTAHLTEVCNEFCSEFDHVRTSPGHQT